MTTIADVGADMLRAAANFFRAVGEENPALVDQMAQNAAAYENVATMLQDDPSREIEIPQPPAS